jgi:hypothetical protein
MRVVYECGVCGGKYRRLDLAEYCEATTLPPPSWKKGDKVLIRTRYGGLHPNTITGSHIVQDYLWEMLGYNEAAPGDEQSVFVMKRAPVTHRWAYELAECEQIESDEQTTFAFGNMIFAVGTEDKR